MPKSAYNDIKKAEVVGHYCKHYFEDQRNSYGQIFLKHNLRIKQNVRKMPNR